MKHYPRKYCVNESFFEDISNELPAYWLGFLWADGHLDNRPRRYRIQLELSVKDRDQLNLFRFDIKSQHPTEERGSPWGHGNVRLMIQSKALCAQLAMLGFKSCHLPLIPTSLLRHFIRGFFDGDGYITHNNRTFCIGFTGKNIELIYNIRRYLQDRIDITDGCSYKRHSGVWDWRLCGNRNIKVFGSYLYENATRFLVRKYARFPDTARASSEVPGAHPQQEHLMTARQSISSSL